MRKILASLALICTFFATPAWAHLISAGSALVSIQSDKTTLLIGVPVSFFTGVDLNSDGLLGPDEITQGRQKMISQLDAAVHLRLGEYEGSVLDDQLMVSVHVDPQKNTNQIEWLRFLGFPEQALTQPASVSLSQSALVTPYMLQVQRPDASETVVLTREYPSHTFLKGAWGTFLAFLEQGVLHILSGYDHVLFLLTLLTSAIAIKRWLLVLTAFTLAHGSTYALATYGVVQVAPQLVEPVIAATIVLAAAVQLLRWQPALSVEASAVFSLGLFHGLGFASSMATLFKEQRFPLQSILGFNAGVEIGQITIAAMLAALMALLARCSPALRDGTRVGRATACVAMLTGSYWLIERIWL